MAFNAAQKFAIAALPLLAAISPANASANCNDDSLGYNQTLGDIEISRDQLNAIQDYNTDAPAIFKEAAKDASANVIKKVLSQYMGTDFVEDGIPAYPAYEDAQDAFLCAMADLLNTRILYAADRAQYFALEEGLIELMIQTAITEDDIRARLDVLSDPSNQSLKPRGYNYTHVDIFIDRAKGIAEDIAANPEQIEGFVSFIINEINDQESQINRASLTRLLGALALENNDYIPDYLNVVTHNPKLLNSTLGIFISDLNTAEYNDEISNILTEQAENAETVQAQTLAANMLSRFTVKTESLLTLE